MKDRKAPLVPRLYIQFLLLAMVVNIAMLSFALAISGLSSSTGHVMSISDLYRDPNAISGLPFIVGWFSNAGAVGWIATATACFFSASLMQGDTRYSLVWFGSLTALLGIDDLFMLHDGLFRFPSIPVLLLFGSYVAIPIFWIARYREIVRRTAWPVFVLASGLLGFALVIDNIADLFGVETVAFQVAEDVGKVLGISFWTIYGIGYAWTATATVDRRDGDEIRSLR